MSNKEILFEDNQEHQNLPNPKLLLEKKSKSSSCGSIKMIIAGIAFILIIVASFSFLAITQKKGKGNLKSKKTLNDEPYDPVPEHEDLDFTEDEHRQLSRQIAAEGIVLAKNVKLPLGPADQVVLFGNGTEKTYYGGTGSGEVYEKGTSKGIKPVTVLQGIENKVKEKKFYYKKNDKGYEIGNGLTEDDIRDFAELVSPAKRSVAILTISRVSGEGSDRKEDSSETGTKINDSEYNTFKALTNHFHSVVVVLNVGSVMEIFDFVRNDNTSIVIAFLPGMEAGNAIADVLTGDVNPSGRLTDTWARLIEHYPTTATFKESPDYVRYSEGLFVGYRYFEDAESKYRNVIYPFGFGLSYTNFTYTKECTFDNGVFKIKSTVKNIGKKSGKEVIQVYAQKPPHERFVKAKRELVAFNKTKELRPNESQTLEMEVKLEDLASYDEDGILGNDTKACYVLEAGNYSLFMATNVGETRDENATKFYTYTLDKMKITQRLLTRLSPKDIYVLNSNIKPNFDKIMEKKSNYEEPNNYDKYCLRKGINEIEEGQKTIPTDKIEEINFKTVLQRKYKMEELVDTMSNEEFAYLTYGHEAKIRMGTGTMGGFYNADLTGKHLIPSADTNDGPAGIRQSEVFLQSACWPCSTMLASTFNLDIMKKVGEETGKEARKLGTSFWLAPGMNIHRNPLCGRNFEYYSEDPFLTGKMAAALTTGLQSKRVSITLKHFALNNKEENRGGSTHKEGLASDSRVSERVAREIYLKGFEIAVKEAHPWAIMTSYNRINGMKAGESYDLLTGILRNEWGFDGLVMTDWYSNSKIAREIHAGNNVKMSTNPGGSEEVLTALKNGMITRDDLKKNTLYILNTLSRTAAIDKLFRDPTPIYLNSTTNRIKIYDNLYNKHPGISYEACGDTEGGYNLINTYQGRWISLFINNEKEGLKNCRIRYASRYNGFGVVFKKYEQSLGEIANLGISGDLQTWETSPDFSIYLPKGTYELTLVFIGYDYSEDEQKYKGNINWIEIDN